MGRATLIPLPTPSATTPANALTVGYGAPISPIERIRIFSPQQWEEFVLEWADSLRTEYVRVDRCGGAGDMGRDVVAQVTANPDVWDNYQCKHYDHALTPGDVWLELGKVVYYSFIDEYSFPRKYYFMAPQAAGTTLGNLFRNPKKLKEGLLQKWPDECEKKITKTTDVPLEASLKRYIDTLDFSIFSAIPPLRVIDQHAKTRWHVSRFGGGLPVRPSSPPAPNQPEATEATYVKCLFDAYSESLGVPIQSSTDLVAHPDVQDHFRDSREEFYSAEALRAFSRDTLPPGEFEKLQGEFHHGIRDELRQPHANGYVRVFHVIKTARSLQITGHSLVSALTVPDRGGICHQLANEGKVKWVK